MDAGFRTYLVGTGLSKAQIRKLTVDQLITSRGQYQQSLAAAGANGGNSGGVSSRVTDVESSVVICRTLLESQVKNYIQDHVKYVNHTKSPKCTHTLTSKTSVSDALDHMQCCPGQLKTWKVFKSNSKLYSSAPGKVVYSALSESVHTAYAKENQVHIPEFLEPIPKRFMLRLFKVLQYRVKVVDRDGNTRDPVPDELDTPEPSPVLKRKRARAESSDDTAKEKKETKKNKKNKKDKKETA